MKSIKSLTSSNLRPLFHDCFNCELKNIHIRLRVRIVMSRLLENIHSTIKH